EVSEKMSGASFGFGLLTSNGQRVFISESFEQGRTFDLDPGPGSVDCAIENPNIVPAVYRFELWISDIPGVQATDHLVSIGEIELATFNIDVAQIEARITPRTVGIVAVHLFGLCADLDPILEIAKRRGLWVVEDAACAFGSAYRERQAGTIGDVACFSFHPR